MRRILVLDDIGRMPHEMSVLDEAFPDLVDRMQELDSSVLKQKYAVTVVDPIELYRQTTGNVSVPEAREMFDFIRKETGSKMILVQGGYSPDKLGLEGLYDSLHKKPYDAEQLVGQIKDIARW